MGASRRLQGLVEWVLAQLADGFEHAEVALGGHAGVDRVAGHADVAAAVRGLAPLPRPMLWVHWLTLCAIAALATMSSGMIVFEADDEFYLRILGIIGILDGCGTLTTPILAKLHSVSGKKSMGHESGDEISISCPQCGGHGTYPLGDITCVKCGLKLRVTVM